MNLETPGLVYPFLAGVYTFFNPCGFALLPSYVSYYLGKPDAPKQSWGARGWHGLALGVTVSAGFFTVFGGLGVVISLIGIAFANKTLLPASPWIAASIGALVILLGLLTLMKRDFSLAGPFERLAAKFQRGQSAGESLAFYYFYGVGYAITSCGCTLPIFAAVLTYALSNSLSNGLLIFGAYAWGMTVMMLALSLLTVFFKSLLQRYLKLLVPWVQRLAGLVMIAAGAYLIYDQIIVSRILKL
ncbi:hypothetical protein HYR54_01030 [Candidatus Acetothermia bacterium]|nr:hypothetical protein [Candidatus Acetothermia bacterium]MBI3460821.1 hypothetical protein [Candidatus Acetothermia bacterium]